VTDNSKTRQDAELIWRAAVDAVQPGELIRTALREPSIDKLLKDARQIIVVGAGKAGAAMATAAEDGLADLLDHVQGLINVPAESIRPLKAIRLHSARVAGSNHPTANGVIGAEQMLQLVEQAGANDVVLCLLSGGGSALLPAPVLGVSLEDKQHVTKLLHACGATINEMNAVRKHLSRIKGGRFAQAFRGKALISLIISDVVGDPLDVIASGPTAPDPTTFGDALAVLQRYELLPRVPPSVLSHLQNGAAGLVAETPKRLPHHVINRIVANNSLALAAASVKARQIGYSVVNLGAFIEGETIEVAAALAGIVRSISHDRQPLEPPVCLLSGGETTVTLAPSLHGFVAGTKESHVLGGRNQEFVLAMASKLGTKELENVVILSAGTDGEDGPTDAAGAFADPSTLARAAAQNLDAKLHLRRHDAYHFFDATADLFKPGLTETNVMDVRVILVGTAAVRGNLR
jgi:glycerate 2-kinase